MKITGHRTDKSFLKYIKISRRIIEKCLQIIQNISSAWVSSLFENKERLQKLVFSEELLYNKIEGVVRTTRINSVFFVNCAIAAGFSKK